VTEAEWDACIDPEKVLMFLRDRTSERKLRLFACACCRRLWRLAPEQSQRVLELVESFADGLASEAEIRQAMVATYPLLRRHDSLQGTPAQAAAAVIITAGGPAAWAAAWNTVTDAMAVLCASAPAGRLAESACQAALARDIFGNPHRKTRILPTWIAWNGGTVEKLAQAVYEQRLLPSGLLDSTRLNILADALEDAGCGEPLIIGHLRSDNEHVRGCWVLDQLLWRS
jgi:hypothetical protein